MSKYKLDSKTERPRGKPQRHTRGHCTAEAHAKDSNDVFRHRRRVSHPKRPRTGGRPTEKANFAHEERRDQ
eukprot:scaffold72144_cov35-Tisochrysis_lutea.AAC.2